MNKLGFSLFRNDKKTGNQPDYRTPLKGVIQIDEPGEYKVAGWKKETKEGQSYLSCMLEKVVAGQSYGATREQNIAQIQQTRQRLEDGPTQGQGGFRGPSTTPPAQHYRPSQPPPPQDEGLPF
jgi:uncharacterized protein (DUF736 family)